MFEIRSGNSWKRLTIAAGNVCVDHVHLVLEIPPNWAVSQVIGYLKGKSALKTMDKFPQLKKRYWNKHFWSPGYCVSTVGLDKEQIMYAGNRKRIAIWKNRASRICLRNCNAHPL